MTQTALGSTLRAARKVLRLSQEDAARRAGLSIRTLSRLESGRLNPSLRSLRLLAYAYGVPFERFTTQTPAVQEARIDTLAGYLRLCRKRKGLTYAQAAMAAGIATVTLIELESGRAQSPHARTLRRLADFYGVPVAQLASLLARKDSELGSYLYRQRIEKGWSLRTVSLNSGIAESTLSRFESGERARPTLRTLRRLAQGYAVTLEELKEFVGQPYGREPEDNEGNGRLGGFLKRRRRELALTQREAADLIGISEGHLRHLELDQVQYCMPRTLKSISNAYGVSVAFLQALLRGDEEENDSLGSRIRHWRLSRAMTLHELSEQTGLSHVAILKIEAGVTRQPRASTMEKLARAIEWLRQGS